MVHLLGPLKGVEKFDRDLLSPYLFAIGMECLSRLLHRAGMEGKFGYHPKYKSICVIHLCFENNLSS